MKQINDLTSCQFFPRFPETQVHKGPIHQVTINQSEKGSPSSQAFAGCETSKTSSLDLLLFLPFHKRWNMDFNINNFKVWISFLKRT